MFFTKNTDLATFDQFLRYRIHGISLQLYKFNMSGFNMSVSLGVKLITVGLLKLIMANVSGALWANDAWGELWTWDSKEIGSALVWILACIYLHNGIQHPKRSLWFIQIGPNVIWLCYFGINFFIIGQHIYKFA